MVAVAVRHSRSDSFCTDLTRSTARRCASVITQAIALPRPASNADAFRHTSSRTSWVTSSDWAGSRITRSTMPNTAGPACSKTASNAAVSPRATRPIWTARSVRGAARAGFSGSGPPVTVTTAIRSRNGQGLAPGLPAAWLALNECARPGKPGSRPHRITDMRDQRSREDRRRAGLGAVAGLLTAATALGVGQLVAGLTGANGSPVVAVGQLQIDFTPPWLKNFAITEFGPDDKLVLVGGILVVLAIFAALIGVAATRRLAYGMAGLAVFAAIGLTAAATRPTATAASLLPTLAATAAAAIVLPVLINRIGPATVSGPPARAEDREAQPGTGVTHGGTEALAAPDLPAAEGPGQPAMRAGAPVPSGAGRRSFLAASFVTAGVAAFTGLAGRAIAERSSVASALAKVRLPKPSRSVTALPPGVDLGLPGLASFI